MTRGVKFRRGSTSDHSGYTGLEGEITVNTDKDCLVVHDGTTVGGFEQVSVASTQTLTNKTLTSPTISNPTITGVATVSTLGVTGLSTTRNLDVVGVTTSSYVQTTNANVSGVTTTATLGVTGFSTARNLTVVGVVTATTFSGDVSGNVSGNVSSTNVVTTNVNATGIITTTTLGVTGFSTARNLTVVGVTTSASFQPTAGTTSVAPILLASGTNLTSATPGAIEYDGHLIYATPKAARGVILSPQYYVLNADRTGPTAASTPTSLLGVTATLKAGTRYLIEAYLSATKSSVNSCALQILTTSSAGTIDRTIFRSSGAASNTRTTLGNGQVVSGNIAGHLTAQTVTAGNATANAWYDVIYRSWVDINAGGDVTGYDILLQWTAIPTTSLFAAGANVSIYSIGPAGGNTSIGSWV